MQTYLSNRQGATTPEQQIKIFNQKMLHGDVRGAFRYLTNSETGGVLMPSNTEEKTGLKVAKVLASKHSDILIRRLWARGTDCIIDVRVTNTDAKSNFSRNPAKVLEQHANGRKRRSTSRTVLSNVIISPHSWSPQMVSLERKQKP
jgi:hypothetical protein